MKTVISQFSICSQRTHFAGSFFLFNCPSPSRENRSSLGVSLSKWHQRPRIPRLSFSTANCASESASYGGWDDFGLDSDRPGEEFRKFLSSVGINDKKQFFVFVLGLLCALAISRVRVSSIVVFPASVLVFAVGFSFGLVRSGGIDELSYGGNKKRSKDEAFRVYIEKIRNLVEIVDDFDVNVNNLKRKIQKAIDSREVTVSDLQDYANVLECIGLSSSNVRNVIEASTENLGSSSVVLAENQKSNRRKKELGAIGFDFLQSIGSLFREIGTDPKQNKVKNAIKRETVEGAVDNQSRNNNLISSVKEPKLSSVGADVPKENVVLSRDSMNEIPFDENGNSRVGNGRMIWEEIDGRAKRSSDSEESVYEKKRTRFLNNHRISSDPGDDTQSKTWESQNDVRGSMNFSVRMKRTETETSFVREQKVKRSDDIREKSEYSTNGYSFREESIDGRDNSGVHESEIPIPSSSTVSDDAVFARYLTEANDLLRQAKEFMRDGHEKERAEMVLYRCAKLLSKAIAMNPENLLAVGLLGNTYLLHGELKLRISRKLRTLLYRSSLSSVRKWDTMRDQMEGRDDISSSSLIDVCEECEELLVEAGRKYRLALSIDGNDVRALYNWGLALTFRAQLISDIGPEASVDADKVFLAAIDKFDAMMSKGSVYAPDALFRWGMVLQQRSRLRPSNSKEKVKLLNQAKRLFEDALDMNSSSVQVREALSICVSELRSKNF